MENFLTKDRRNSPRVPVKTTVLGEYAGCRIAMYSENISLDGMFILAADFIPPRAVFSARIWLSPDQEPLQAYLTSCFIERTWSSYGMGTCISGISTADKVLWENFYRCCVEAQEEQKQLAPPRPPTGKLRMVVVAGSLSPAALHGLQQPWLEVVQAASTSEALALVQELPADALLSDLQRPGVDGLKLCREIGKRHLQPRIVLLNEGGRPSEFLQGIQAGAARVIGKQCSPNVLVGRILEALKGSLASRPAQPSPAVSQSDLGLSRYNAPSRASAALPFATWATP